MRCPHCKADTFKRKPHLDPNAKSVHKYKESEQKQYFSHVKKCYRRIERQKPKRWM